MEKPKPQRCQYVRNGCEREDITLPVKIHMCEGDLFFKCYEYSRLNESVEEVGLNKVCYYV